MSDKVLDTLVAWGERTHGIRAMILTSTRARPDGPVDEFSDYDVILAVTDQASFAWSFAAGVHGRGLERYLDRETFQELSDTCASLDPDEIWTALFRLVELFRRVPRSAPAVRDPPHRGGEPGRPVGYPRAVRSLLRFWLGWRNASARSQSSIAISTTGRYESSWSARIASPRRMIQSVIAR